MEVEDRDDSMITVSKRHYEDLVDDRKMLLALQNAGVDNWSGYYYAMAEYNGEDPEW